MTTIEIKNLEKNFSSQKILKNINLEIKKGEFLALLGPSGSGKTTLLRIIAGLEKEDSGTITIDGKILTGTNIKDRGVGFIFQHYALFKHMTIFDNIAFGLNCLPKKNRPTKSKIESKVNELLKMVQLEKFMKHFPSQLSGGQKQRVALARALAVHPKILLLDEPFGALDTNIRAELRLWLRKLHEEINMTSVFVTHDIDEALELADRIVVMNKGEIIQVGTPDEIYNNPINEFVFKFIGDVNLFHGRNDGEHLFFLNHKIPISDTMNPNVENSDSFQALIRNESIQLSLEQDPNKNSIPAIIRNLKNMGHSIKIELNLETGETTIMKITSKDPISKELHLNKKIFVLFDKKDFYIPDFQI